jgi:hypothetical protein
MSIHNRSFDVEMPNTLTGPFASEPRPNPLPSVDSHMTQTELCLTHSDYRMSQSTQLSVTNSNVRHYVLWLSVTYIINWFF